MSKQQKTKQGVAAIYIVVFTTMLIGIITLSFLRIMLSESGRTLNDTLSDSAYNAALAGVEDAKYVIAQYEKKIVAGKNASTDNLVKVIEESNGSDCDVITRAMTNSGAVDEGEKSVGTNGESYQDQAYTCVTLNLEGDFVGVLSSNSPTLVVPLKPAKNGEHGVSSVNDVSGVKISWVMNTSSSDEFSGNSVQTLDGDFKSGVNNPNALKDDSDHRVLGKKGIKSDDLPTALNGLRMMLVQSPAGVSDPDYYASDTAAGRTNRASLMLLASTDGEAKIAKSELVDSADKTLNKALSVKCTDDGVCSANIEFPQPKGGDNRNPDNFFLVLNQLYSEPSIKVTVNMLKGDVTKNNIVNFFNVQPIIDSTGRSGDLFRRVEARVGTDNGASLIPTAELATGGDINKNFYVTKNCINGTKECK